MLPIPVSGLGGVNLFHDPRALQPNQLTRAKNVFPTKTGRLSKRKAAQYAEQIFTRNLATLDRTLVNFIFNPSTTGPRYCSVDIYNDGTLLEMSNGVSTVNIASSPATDRRPFMLTFDKKIYCLQGNDPASWPSTVPWYPLWYQDTESDVHTTTITGLAYATSQTILRAPRVACIYKGRMVYGNFGPGYENFLTWADDTGVDQVGADFLSPNAPSVNLPAAVGDRIVAMAEVTQTAVANPTTSVLLVLCERSTFIIEGEPLLTTETPDTQGKGYSGDLVINQMSEPAGCVSAETLVRTPYGLIWAGPDDVWGFPSGQLPRRIGTYIRPALTVCPAFNKWRWFAAYHDGAYRLAIHAEGQDPGNTVPMSDQWWLDLKNGIPESYDQASWWGPQVYVCAQTIAQFNETQPTPTPGLFLMRTEEKAGGTTQLFGATPGVESYDNSTGNIASWILVSLDADVPFDSALHLHQTGDSVRPYAATETNNEVTIELITKEYSTVAFRRDGLPVEDAVVDKVWMGVELDLWNGNTLELSSSAILNGGQILNTQSVEVTNYGFMGDVDSLDDTSTFMSKIPNAVLIPRDASTICRGKTYQLSLYDTAGFVVTASNKYFYFAPTGGTPVRTATLTEGFYANIDTFLTMFLAALNAVVTAGTFTAVRYVNNSPFVSYYDFVRLTNASGFVIGFQTIGTDADIKKSTRRIGAALGLATDADFSGTTCTGEVSPRPKEASSLEFGSLIIKINPTGRRPS